MINRSIRSIIEGTAIAQHGHIDPGQCWSKAFYNLPTVVYSEQGLLPLNSSIVKLGYLSAKVESSCAEFLISYTFLYSFVLSHSFTLSILVSSGILISNRQDVRSWSMEAYE